MKIGLNCINMENLEMMEHINDTLRDIKFTFEINDKIDKPFFKAVRLTSPPKTVFIWVNPYSLNDKIVDLIIEDPLKQLENVKKYFYYLFPQFKNKLKGWKIGFNAIISGKDKLSVCLNKIDCIDL